MGNKVEILSQRRADELLATAQVASKTSRGRMVTIEGVWTDGRQFLLVCTHEGKNFLITPE